MKGQSRIRLLLVDDHPVVRKGICSCLARQPEFEVVGEAADGLEALRQVAALTPDIVLMDLNMPRMGGLEATKRLHAEHPQVKVLILSVQGDKPTVTQIIRSGACGYVLKDTPTEDLIHAIRVVHRGDAFFSPNVARLLLNQYITETAGAGDGPLRQLTAREIEVLTLIAEGLSNKEAASQLNVSVRTVEAHRERIMRKLNLRSVVGLTKFAIQQRLVSVQPPN